DLVAEAAEERVEPEQVRQGLRLGEIADGADRDVLAGVEEAEEVAADPSESVDADPRHGLLSKPRPRFARPRLPRGVLSHRTHSSRSRALASLGLGFDAAFSRRARPCLPQRPEGGKKRRTSPRIARREEARPFPPG